MKATKGMSNLLHEACKEAREGNHTLKKQVQFMGNKFLNAVETSAQEAVYTILQLPLVQKSRETVFINTCHPDERARILKPYEELQQLKST